MEVHQDKVKKCIVASLQLALSSQPSDEGAPPPSTLDLVQMVSFILSRLEPEVGPCSTSILQASLKETLQVAISNLHADIKSKCSTHDVFLSPSPWSGLARLSSSASSAVLALYRLRKSLSLLLSTHLQVVMALSCDPTPILRCFHATWGDLQDGLTQMVSGLTLDSDPQWSHCLATVWVCLVVGEVSDVVVEILGDGGGAGWLAKERGVSRLLDNLDKDFPPAVHQKYQKWEWQEVNGSGTGQLVLKVQ